jgi:hypothetical protein
MTLSLFTEPAEFDLPHPRVSVAIFLVLEEAVCAAWSMLRAQPPAGCDLKKAAERVLTHHLHETLQDKVWNRTIVDGFDAEVFSSVTRGPEVRSFDGGHPDKRPDMVVQLVDIPERVRPSQYGIFIECKKVDAAHSMLSDYCDEGILRFVRGDYAWAMTEAMMIGYADSGKSAVEALGSALKKRAAAVLPAREPWMCARTASAAGVPVAITEHGRNFVYIETGQAAPAIMLRHLWLQRN